MDARDCLEAPHSPRDWQRFYLGYRERFVEDCCIQLPNGREVRLKQAPSAKQFNQQGGGRGSQKQQQQQRDLDKQSDPALTGSTVWDGAVVLAQHLCSSSSPLHDVRTQHTSSSRQNSGSSSVSDSNGTCGQGSCPGQEQQQQLQQEGCCQPLLLMQAVADSLQQQDHHHHQQQQQQQHNCHGDAAAPTAHHALTCLELGAGTGAVSLCLLAAGVVDYAVLTDIPDMLPHLQSNAEHNSGVLNQQRALVLPLRWSEAADVAALQRLGQQQQRRRRPQLVREALPKLPPQLQPPFDLIVGSDLIYYSYTPSTPHSRLLLQALVQLAGPNSLVFLALSLHHNPQEVHAFLDWAQHDWGFEVSTVTQGIPQEYVVPDVLVVKLSLQDPGKAAAAAAAAAAGTLRRKDEGC